MVVEAKDTAKCSAFKQRLLTFICLLNHGSVGRLDYLIRSAKKGIGVFLAVDNNRNVFVGLASMPSRVESLSQVVQAVLPQCGRLGVYLNNFEEVPSFLSHPKIEIARSQDHGDFKDNGKFFFVQKSELRYYATIDDDIEYPSNYIAHLLSTQFLTKGIVGVHASYYPKEVKSLLENRHVLHFRESFDHLLPATLIGTGTSLVDQGVVQLKFPEFGTPGMADVWLAVAAKKRGIPLWVVPRPDSWLRAISQPLGHESTDLYSQGKRDDSAQVKVLNEAGIYGSIPAMLESIVRVPNISNGFSISDANFLWGLTRKINIETLRRQDRSLYDFALQKHKAYALKRDRMETIEPWLETYSQWLVEMLSRDEGARVRDTWAAEYQSFVASHSRELLPRWAIKDAELLEKKNLGEVNR